MTLQDFQPTATKVIMLLFLTSIIYGIAEIIFEHFIKKTNRIKEFRTTAFGLIFSILVSVGISALYGRVNTVIIGLWASKFAFFQTDLSWYWWIYGLVIYEFFYFIQHYLAHKVRLFWCLHSPHHAPESMNMFVGFNHSFLESLFYMPFFLGFFPALLGVHPIILITMYGIDAIYGSWLHVSDHVVKNGRYGFLEKFMQTPAHHRVHHAQNVVYMDTNFCSITLIWDLIFKTEQPLKSSEPIRYGITRNVNTNSFWDTHFGEFILLTKDILKAKGFVNRIKYLLMPPGWSPEGELQTATYLKQKLKMEGQFLG